MNKRKKSKLQSLQNKFRYTETTLFDTSHSQNTCTHKNDFIVQCFENINLYGCCVHMFWLLCIFLLWYCLKIILIKFCVYCISHCSAFSWYNMSKRTLVKYNRIHYILPHVIHQYIHRAIYTLTLGRGNVCWLSPQSLCMCAFAPISLLVEEEEEFLLFTLKKIADIWQIELRVV